jgi:hypothetical protein
MEVNVEQLFKALKHDATLTALALVMVEIAGGEPVEIPESVWGHHINHYRHQLREALGIGKEEVTK